jgi:hypothetical protein
LINFLPKEKALGCFRHKNPVVMQQSSGTEKDGTPMAHLFCPRCSSVIPFTAELKTKLEVAITEESAAQLAREKSTS